MNWVRFVARVGFYCFWKVCLWVDFSGIGLSGEDLSFLLSLFLGWGFPRQGLSCGGFVRDGFVWGRVYRFIGFVVGMGYSRKGLSWGGFVRYGFVWGGFIFLLGLFLGWGLSDRGCLGVDLSDMDLYGEGLFFY